RDTVVKAEHKPATPFVFDTFYADPSKFIIALNASFLVTEELVQLQRLASAMTAKSEIGTQDDGFSQTVTVKRGEVTTAEVKLKPRCKLVPMRTFDEAAPVESEFLVRLKQTEQGVPAIALFSVDGTKWQGQCMQSIKNWLQQALGTAVPVLA
ncbi:MAG TPA: hypothetical protein VGT42_06540, partial [Gammaproteobacteria bacterium]|nr:hypothetical protein [Gammaproteobacteria bacterium]